MSDVIQNKLFEQKLALKKRVNDSVAENTEYNKYAVCLVNIKAMGVRTFSYEIPLHFQNKIKIGQALLVPFGRQGMINAFCVGFSNYLPPEIKAKPVTKILDETPLFSSDYLKLLEWVANYYCTDLITVLNAAIPLKLIEKSLKTELSIEYVRDFGATKRQLQVLEILKNKGKMPLVSFEKLAKTTRATVKKLEALGCVRICEEEIYRNPLDILNIDKIEPLNELSSSQQEVYEGISKQIKKEKSSRILLHGVTASGKTEVYFKLINDTIKSGKNVLFLAPEIALASQLTKRLAKKFGTKDVAIWHSSISEGERYDVWQKLYKNEIKILAGARSAVFAPLQNIGLIIIDEEHEGAYKQTTPAPRYDARLVAQKLAEFNACPLILGSATPDISSYYYAVNSNHLYQMLHRYNNAKVAPVTVINMQEYGQAAYKHLISLPLQNAIKETLDKGLEKTKESVFGKLARAVAGKSKVDDDVLDNLEEILISSDVGVDTTVKIIERIEERVARDKYVSTSELNGILREEIANLLSENHSDDNDNWDLPSDHKPYVILVVGVNGVGKTTTIGKLAYQFKKAGKKVYLGAADTFRAAAVEQISIWGERVGVPVIKQQMGSDPASVAFDTLQSAKANDADVVLIDTAGRLHNKVGLMNELKKIKDVMKKVLPQAPDERFFHVHKWPAHAACRSHH